MAWEKLNRIISQNHNIRNHINGSEYPRFIPNTKPIIDKAIIIIVGNKELYLSKNGEDNINNEIITTIQDIYSKPNIRLFNKKCSVFVISKNINNENKAKLKK